MQSVGSRREKKKYIYKIWYYDVCGFGCGSRVLLLRWGRLHLHEAMTSTEYHRSRHSIDIVQKGSILGTWEPHTVIPFWKAGPNDDRIFLESLPGFQPCPILSHLSQPKTPPTKELESFVNKIFQDQSFEALVMLTVIELVLHESVRSQPSIQTNTTLQRTNRDTAKQLDDDESLLVEGWPLFQESISWPSCCRLHTFVRENLHEITLPHPLTKYAKENLLDLAPPVFEKAVERALGEKWIPSATSNKLRMSQYLLDYAASLPSRRVGVLKGDPNSVLPSTAADVQLYQSCLPSAALELAVSSSRIQCHVISLYDADRKEKISLSSKPPPAHCKCLRCSYDRDSTTKTLSESANCDPQGVQRLAHALFQEHKYDEAKELYTLCHDDLSTKDRVPNHGCAEMWHAIGAVDLTRRKFIQAQEHWKQGSHYAKIHKGIALQLEKQEAYGYFTSPMPSSSIDNVGPPFEYETILSKRIFAAKSLISNEICQNLICWAEEYGEIHGGWTTSRHYAVPTNDVPVHEVPRLRTWFQRWMNEQCQALLRQQFQTRKRFYVHDAFLVRYAASSKSRYLPLHSDESTHSMVLALNDEFEGGGTYFFDVDRTICPSTGSLITFRGDQLLHGGNPVVTSVRYILAVFLYLDDDEGSTGLMCDIPDDVATKRQKTLGVTRDKGDFAFDFFK